MKKKLLLVLGLSSLLVLAGCGGEGNSSDTKGNDSSSKQEEAVSFKDFAEKFNAKVVQKVVVDSQEESASYLFDYAADHVSIVFDGDYDNYYFKKGKTGALEGLSLNEENEVVTKTTDEKFDDHFPNVFKEIDGTTDLTLAKDGKFTELGGKFLSTFLPFSASEDSYSDVTASMTTGKDFVFSFQAKTTSEQIEVQATLLAPSEYKNYVLSPLAETEESKGIATTIEKLQAKNYTCTVKKGDILNATYYLNPTALLIVQGDLKQGFVKTDDGYSTVVIKNDAPFSGTSSSNSFSSLLPSFEFAPEIIVNGKIAKGVHSSNLSRIFLFDNDRKDDLKIGSFKMTSASFEYVVGEGEDALTISFSNIGNTTLPIDILNPRAENWENTNLKVHQFLSRIAGDDYDIPAWKGINWDLYPGFNPETATNLSLTYDVSDVDDALASLHKYIELLDKTSLKKWGDADYLKASSMVDPSMHDDGNLEIYYINSDYCLEVYYAEEDFGYGEILSTLYFYINQTSYFVK